MGTTGGGTEVDMGASWIHGIGPGAGSLNQYNNMENPIFTIAKENNISTVATWQDEDYSISKAYWWKSTTSTLSQTRITNMETAILTHVKNK